MKPLFEEGKFYTIGTENGKILEVADTSLDNGGIVRIYNDWLGRPRPWQLWKFEKASDYDDYRIINKLSGKALDVINQSSEAGSWLHQWDKTGAYSQVWFIQPAEDGKFKLLNVPQGKVLDIVGMNPEDFARVQLWDDVDGANQKWIIREVDPVSYEAKQIVSELPKEEEKEEAQTDFVAEVSQKEEGDQVFTFSEIIEPGHEEATALNVEPEKDAKDETVVSVSFDESLKPEEAPSKEAKEEAAAEKNAKAEEKVPFPEADQDQETVKKAVAEKKATVKAKTQEMKADEKSAQDEKPADKDAEVNEEVKKESVPKAQAKPAARKTAPKAQVNVKPAKKTASRAKRKKK